MESILLDMALSDDKPVFGICRGIQFMNAYLGGDLFQDLPTEYESTVEHHMEPPYDVAAHKVRIVENTILSEILGEGTIEVNSYHHQAVKSPAKRAEVMAVSEDGLVEAISVKGQKFAVGVQWHPERLDASRTSLSGLPLLRHFLQLCAEASPSPRSWFVPS